MHLSTGPDYTQNVIKVYCPVDADAGCSHVEESILVAAGGCTGGGEEVCFLVGFHVAIAVADVGRGGCWRLVHLFFLFCVGRQVDEVGEARWGTT